MGNQGEAQNPIWEEPVIQDPARPRPFRMGVGWP